jgi:hypothetical protein
MNINDIKQTLPESKTGKPLNLSYRMMPISGPNCIKIGRNGWWQVFIEKNGILVDSENNKYFDGYFDEAII